MQGVGIYGAGGYGRAFYRAMTANGVTPAFFVDQFCQAPEVLGIPVLRIEQLADADATIYVSLALTPSPADPGSDIVATLNGAGINNVRSFTESLHEFPEALEHIIALGYLWMRDGPKNTLDPNGIEQCRQLLSDDVSRDTLDRIVAFRQHPTAGNYVPPDGQTEYFPGDIDLFSRLDAIRFVDAGAYTGDTIGALVEHCARINKAIDYSVSFEPDADNYVQLLSELSRAKAASPTANFMALPMGLWSSNTVLHFATGNGSSTAVSDSTGESADGTSLPVVTLDSVLPSAPPNFIKMDIEGAEREALLGARHLIQRHSPVLAICVYHRPADLWELPLLIHRLNPNYRMHLRVHSHMGLSTVLYCVP
ncbi:MAG: FkbM family methyltransferase [Chromatiaceae bacterium]|nr:FkbM family methyltransferase [Chromatiaceae bacterium]MCP5422118.1 FkbM family methyltransferase [Chromatiaceae bacterium]